MKDLMITIRNNREDIVVTREEYILLTEELAKVHEKELTRWSEAIKTKRASRREDQARRDKELERIRKERTTHIISRKRIWSKWKCSCGSSLVYGGCPVETRLGRKAFSLYFHSPTGYQLNPPPVLTTLGFLAKKMILKKN